MALREIIYRISLLIVLLIFAICLLFFYNHGSSHNGDGTPSRRSYKDQLQDSKAIEKNQMFSAEELLFFATGEEKPGSGNVRQRLAKYIRTHIARPSGIQPKQSMNHHSQFGESQAVDKLLGGRTNGFFLECGALGGEYLSNSLFFERARNWTGLLIEANPASHKELLSKGRNAYILPVCLSPKNVPSVMHFKLNLAYSGIAETLIHKSMKNDPDTALNCFPIHDVIDAIGVKHIDYFSLDVEGAELMILKTMDFTRITVDIFTIEYATYKEQLKGLRKFFNDTHTKTGQLYEEVMLLPEGSEVEKGFDVVFRRKI